MVERLARSILYALAWQQVRVHFLGHQLVKKRVNAIVSHRNEAVLSQRGAVSLKVPNHVCQHLVFLLLRLYEGFYFLEGNGKLLMQPSSFGSKLEVNTVDCYLDQFLLCLLCHTGQYRVCHFLWAFVGSVTH